ncbi:MAG: hypothetical protein WCF18_21150 [Chthoniobacteraceae bacterium]
MRSPIFLLLGVLTFSASGAEPAARWWKGNLHTHSLWSDGNDYPEMIAAWYKDRGWNFLALSDHNILSDHERWIAAAKGGPAALEKYVARWGEPWVERRVEEGEERVRLKTLAEFRGKLEEPGRFLMVQSEEITAPTVHINATNIQEKILPYTANTSDSAGVVAAMQRTVSAVLEQRQRTGVPMFPHINHPNFKWAITAEELMQVEGERFFEIYNGHPLVRNEGDELHAGTERMWDILLTERLAVLGKEGMYGLATDDAHNYHNEPKKLSHPGRGWVMVRAEELEIGALIAALEAGDFYSSSGVTLKDVRREKGRIALEIEPESGVTYTTEFIGTRTNFDRASQPVPDANGAPLRVTQRYSKDIGTVLARVEGTSASYTPKGDEIYVRARVVSSKRKADPAVEGEFEQAWTQPLVVSGR